MARRKAAYTHAVLMGDLIGSESSPSVRRLHEAFNRAVQAINTRRRKQLTSRLTITLGDEFQGLAPSLAAGLSVIRELRAALLADKVRCRFVLGLARLETPLNTSKSWNMMGPGLSKAREKLADKRSPNSYRFSLPDDPAFETLLDAVGMSVTEIEDSWTARQFEIAGESMTNAEQIGRTAERLGIARNTFYKIRRAARLEMYEGQWSAIETAIADLDRRHGFG